jgi:hypothetical protein
MTQRNPPSATGPGAPAGQMLIYQAEDGRLKIEARLDGETLWLTQQQMAELFQTARSNVVEHIRHVYDEGELEEEATCRNFRQVRADQRFDCFEVPEA